MLNRSVPSRQIFIAGAVFCATGASLLVYIFAGISLGWTILAVGCLAALVLAAVWRRLNTDARTKLWLRLKAGVIAGIPATLAYDGSRFLLIKLTGIHFWPFDIFRIFGQALIGPSASPALPYLGFLYHVANGVGFAIAYAVWRGEGGPLWGIAWAMFLEFCMVSVYPGWLGMKALDEFLQVSIFGHLIYGSILGWGARAYLNRAHRERSGI